MRLQFSTLEFLPWNSREHLGMPGIYLGMPGIYLGIYLGILEF